MEFKLSQHAEEKLKQRGIKRTQIEAVLNAPQQILDEDGKKVYQSKLERVSGKTHLLRIVVASLANPPVVVTAYWTDQIDKYWREET